MKRYLIPVMLFALSSMAHAQTFDALIDSVIDNNITLKADREQYKSELYDAKSDNMLPSTEIEFGYLWGWKEAGNKLDATISQEFDWPGAYSARRKAIKIKSEALDFLNRSNELEKRLEIKLIYIAIINNKKNRQIIEERLEIMDRLIEKYSRGVELGQLSRLDLNKLLIEKIRLKNSDIDLITEFDSLKSSLEALNGGRSCEMLIDRLSDYPDEMVLTLEEYDNLLADADPMSKYNEAMFKSQLETVKAEKRMRFPGFTLGYTHSVEEGETFNGMTVGVKLPSFSSGNKIKAAKAMSESLAYQQNMLALERRAEMLSNRNKTLSLLKKYSEYKTVLKNDDSMQQLKKSFDAGEISLIDYLSEMDFFLIANQDMLQLEYEYMTALANLNKYRLLR